MTLYKMWESDVRNIEKAEENNLDGTSGSSLRLVALLKGRGAGAVQAE